MPRSDVNKGTGTRMRMRFMGRNRVDNGAVAGLRRALSFKDNLRLNAALRPP